MARKRVIAHFMHEDERNAARPLLSEVQETDAYLLGEVEEDEIPRLEAQGCVLQFVPEPAEPETPGLMAEPESLRAPQRARFRSAGAGTERRERDIYLLNVQGPLLDEWRGQLDELGVRLIEYVPDGAYTAQLESGRADAVAELPFIGGVRPYGAEDSAPPSGTSTRALDLAMEDEDEELVVDVRLHQPDERGAVAAWLRGIGANVRGASARKVRVDVSDDPALVEEIAARPEVAAVHRYVEPELHNDLALRVIGVGDVTARVLPYTGRDQLVGVADTGIDDAHPDLRQRVATVIARAREGDASDHVGHGTHVAGSIAGDGTASGGSIQGVAPEASLVFQSIADDRGRLSGLPFELQELFKEAYDRGARIHNNSWGAATKSTYTGNSNEVDEFVASHRDMLIIVSAGNDGSAREPLNAKPGFVDWLSIGSPASSKNSLTVGASRNSRTEGGFSTRTYFDVWRDRFPDEPISLATISGDAESIAGFSSRGPCDDRRIKPDVVAPGTDILSVRSSLAPERAFWGLHPDERYAYMGGTSMSAPIVAGCAALVREYYVRERGHEPSAALLKATLVNGTRRLEGPDALADHPQVPNYHQGFGCVYMPWTVPNPSEPELALEFADPWQPGQPKLSATGERARFAVACEGGRALRVCLTWTDPPARALQNNLNLFLQHLPSRQKWMGNAELPNGLNMPDPDNNIEIVRIDDPPPGEYLIQITATNLVRPPQDFALVVTGALAGQLQRR